MRTAVDGKTITRGWSAQLSIISRSSRWYLERVTNETEGWMSYGASLAGSLTGGLVGGAATNDLSGAMIGAGVGAVVEVSLSEAAHQYTSRRQQKRIGALITMARDRLLKNIADGETLRTDPFLRRRINGRSPAHEVLEHVIQVAQGTFEERKLPYIAAALANIAVHSEINEVTAHWIVSTLESLSWPKLVALALVGGKDARPLPDISIGRFESDWASWSAHEVFHALYYYDQLLSMAQTPSRRLPDPNLSHAGLTVASNLIYQAAELESIPSADRDELLRSLAAGTTP
jgi:hypothetical protein